MYLGATPHPVTVTTRIIPFLIGNPYKPSFVTVTGWGDNPRCTYGKSINVAIFKGLDETYQLVTWSGSSGFGKWLFHMPFVGLFVVSWVVPPPSKSHHQDYCIFSRGSL